MPFLAVLQDRGHEMADAKNDAPDVDAHDEVPIALRHIVEAHPVHRHAGIVAGDVQLAEILLGLALSASTTDCSKVTSRRTGMTRLLVPERRCAASSTASFWMSAMTTLAPASASAVAMPSPMPEAAPVTIAVLPQMSCIGPVPL